MGNARLLFRVKQAGGECGHPWPDREPAL